MPAGVDSFRIAREAFADYDQGRRRSKGLTGRSQRGAGDAVRRVSMMPDRRIDIIVSILHH
jgi:hypothetical protein